MYVVYMARKDFPCTDHYALSAEDARRLGDVGSGTQVQDALLYRMWILNSRESSVTATWMEHWSLKEPIANPPNRNTIPNKLTYVTHCALDMAYVTPPENTETLKKYTVIHDIVPTN